MSWSNLVAGASVMSQLISVERIFDGQTIHTDSTVEIEHGKIVGLSKNAEANTAMHISGLLSPGFVDLQANGGGGVLLNTTPTRAGMKTIADAHRHFGTAA